MRARSASLRIIHQLPHEPPPPNDPPPPENPPPPPQLPPDEPDDHDPPEGMKIGPPNPPRRRTPGPAPPERRMIVKMTNITTSNSIRVAASIPCGELSGRCAARRLYSSASPLTT